MKHDTEFNINKFDHVSYNAPKYPPRNICIGRKRMQERARSHAWISFLEAIINHVCERH